MTENGGPVSLLEGCRVLDLTDEKGSYCGRMLGDYGADVILIEPPGGSPARQFGPYYKDQVDPEKSLSWFYNNANKRGITLDLESEEGLSIFMRLVDTADVVVESGPPGYLDRLGVGWTQLHQRKPSLVLTSISPFGQTGPYRDFVADDLVLMAMGGMARMFGYLDSPPLRITAPQAYYLGSAHAAVATALSFYHAELTGEGQLADVSIQEAVVLSLMVATEIWEFLRVNPRGTGPFFISPRPAPQRPLMVPVMWPVKDGMIMLTLMGGAQRGAAGSSKAIFDWANAEGYASDMAGLEWDQQDHSTLAQEEVSRWQASLSPWLMTKTKAELFARAVESGLLIAPVNTIKDLAESPQLAARGFWTAVLHPELNETLVYPGAPVKMSEAPWSIRRRAPLIGEHNREVYEGELGLPSERVARMRSRGVI
ncbi:MAG: CaiB/BaiF CoA transferase family protein [Chloroflexota bacterium]